MKNLFKKTGALLRQTWMWTLLLVLCLALTVWFVGPALAVDDRKFWDSATSRLLTISALTLSWGLAMVYVGWRAGVRTKADEDSADGQARSLREERMNEDRAELRTRFSAALKTLKTSGLYRGRSEPWRTGLPWYLLIGPEGSGKTSLLDCSGLDFPLDKVEGTLSRNAQTTRHCDWYFANNGVLLDTPGRYLTQSAPEVDRSAWIALLGLLRKHRRNRPLNGVLVMLPVDMLLNGSEPVLETLARQVRARLQEVHQKLHVEVPVYLVLSKADSLSGFDEFFDHLTADESDQVLGTSFREGQSGTHADVLRDEFGALLLGLNSQVITRIHQERDHSRRGLILDFPRQLSSIGERLCLFVELAFTGSRYQSASQLRGFYLTSATRAAQQDASIGADMATAAGTALGALPTARSSRSRFIHHLLSRVIFPEAELAGLDTRERHRIHWAQRGLYLGAFMTLALFGILWAGSFSSNYERLDRVSTLARTWAEQRAAPSFRDDFLATLKTLDTRYAATQVFPDKGEVGYRARGGLYQGEAVNGAVAQAYERELEAQLLPQVAAMLEAQIAANQDNREGLLKHLRAYLMLGMRDRRDAPWLKDEVAAGWSELYPDNAAVQNTLNGHFERLMELPFVHSLNDQRVAQTRQVLRGESLATVVYRILREQASNLPAYSLDQHLGPQAAMFVGTDFVIPGFYTRQGYQQYFSLQGSRVVADILRDNWVLGEGSGLSDMDLRRLMVELEQLYFRDYADHWGEAVSAVELAGPYDFADSAQQMAGLTSAHSPVVNLLREVREHTRFTPVAEALATALDAKAQPEGKDGVAGKMAAVAASKASDALTGSLPDTARKSLQSRFDPLHRLLDDKDAPAADLLPVLAMLNELQMQMASLSRAGSPEQAAFDMAKSRMGGQRDALGSLRAASSRLPRPVGAWINALAEDAWRLVLSDAYRHVNQRYQSEVYGFYGKAISKRYPFKADSASDVALSDFREFFKAQGLADRFFDSFMRPFVSGEAGTLRLRSIDGQSLPVSRGYLEQMALVRVIRQGFFADSSAEPQVQFKLEPHTLDSSVSRSEFRLGDKTLEYRHGPIVAVSFKWPTDAEAGRTSLVLDRMIGRPLGIEESTGPWSLFRLLDSMERDELSGRDVLVLKADVGGLRASYVLTSQRSPNPFDLSALRSFRMPAQL
jgi:type VI secretion system protein ImpL